jgi:hypothetical protein
MKNTKILLKNMDLKTAEGAKGLKPSAANRTSPLPRPEGRGNKPPK